jgi:C-terminal processing protease CtpA/Prc
VLEGNGVVPDIAVELDRASLLAGRDVQLEAAILAAGGG